MTGFDLRASLLEGFPRVRAAYYVASFLCGLGATLRPGAARAIARAESAGNIALLAGGVMVAYAAVLDSAAGPGDVVNPFTPEAVANLALSAGWAYLSWVRVSAGP